MSVSRISQLPVELVRVILADVASGSATDRKTLMGVCFEWKEILCGTPSVWTTITLRANKPTDKQFWPILKHLATRLRRCGALMLDVICNVHSLSGPAMKSLFALLSRRAPFTRWRTLELWDHPHSPVMTANLENMGDFRNLEWLTVHEYSQDRFLKLVNKSATSKLAGLAIKTWYFGDLSPSEYGNVLRCLRRLELVRFSDTPELPVNLLELKVRYLPDGTYPYLKLLHCTGRQNISVLSRMSLPNLVSLAIAFSNIPPPPSLSSITLPNLTTFTVYGSEFGVLATISTPKLQSLLIQMSTLPQHDLIPKYEWLVDTFSNALARDSFSLSPSAELDLGSSLLPIETLSLAVSKMSRAKRVIIKLSNIEREWLDVVIVLTKVNTGLVLRGSALLADTLVLKPEKEMKRLDSAARRLMAEEILRYLRTTGIRLLKIDPQYPGDGPSLVVGREDVCT